MVEQGQAHVPGTNMYHTALKNTKKVLMRKDMCACLAIQVCAVYTVINYLGFVAWISLHQQILNLAMIVFSALMMWKSLIGEQRMDNPNHC